MTNFPQFKKLSIYDDYEPSKVSNSTGTISNNHYHKQIGNTMSEMTTSKAIEVLKVLLTGDGWDKDTQQALDKAIEVMENVLELKRMSDKGDIKITKEYRQYTDGINSNTVS